MDERAAAPGPTVILIGGQMTVDDGTAIDSRQAVDGDPSSRVTHAALATSLLWWITAASVAGPVLDSAPGDAFALLLGGRTVTELRPDGTMRRTGLRSFLPGGTAKAEIKLVRDEVLPGRFRLLPDAYHNGTIGIDRGEPGKRWRFYTGNEYFLRHGGTAIGPAVVIDTSRSLMDGTKITGQKLDDLQETRLFDSSIVLILPHTHRAEALINAWHSRLARRWYGPMTSSDWDPEAPPDPVRYAAPIPVQADFGITGLSAGGTWRDPSDLEAARSLLQARYDLKIGIWDLAGNPVLRRTLLQPSPTPEAPAETAAVPPAAARRAHQKVAAIASEQAAMRAALDQISAHLGPLHQRGWKTRQPGSLRLGLTEEFPRWDGPEPLVWLHLTISKRQAEVTGFALQYNHPDINIDQYIKEHSQALSRIAAPGQFAPNDRWTVLWREQGGWDDPTDWPARVAQIVARTDQWRQEFRELCNVSLEIANGVRPYPDWPG
jgi:hypothetical protein